jgi:hypothetical protein
MATRAESSLKSNEERRVRNWLPELKSSVKMNPSKGRIFIKINRSRKRQEP